jgi:hypothetical protein
LLAGINPTAPGQPNVHHNYVRFVLKRATDGFVGGGSFGNNLPARLPFQEPPQSQAHDFVIINYHYLHGITP